MTAPLDHDRILQSLEELEGTLAELHAAVSQDRELQRVLAAVALGSRQLLTCHDLLEEGIPQVLRLVGEAASVTAISLLERVPPEGDAFEVVARHHLGPPEEQWPPDIPPLTAIGADPWFDELREDRAIRLIVHELPDEFAEVLRIRNVGTVLGVPVQVDGRFWGVLVLSARDASRPWTAAEEAILRILASSVGGALTRRRAREREIALTSENAELRRVSDLNLLAAGIAHDVNNALSAIEAYRSLILDVEDLPADVRRDAEGMGDCLQRAGELVHRLRLYAREELPDRKRLLLDAAVNESVAAVAPLIPDGVDIALDTASGATVGADPTQLGQVVSNLVLNAVEAGATRVRVTTRLLPIGTPGAESGGAELEVDDDGHGLEAAEPERLFEPFYSTRGEGRGMGLASVRSIVELHGGTIAASHSAGGGTRIVVRLPLAEPR